MGTDGSGTVSREELNECAKSSDIVRLFTSLDWPKGWTLDDLHTMLDADGGGTLTREEFCDGMHRLIFGNDFQKSCMNMLIAGQIKQVGNEIKVTTSEELAFVRKSIAEVKHTLQTVLAEVRSIARKDMLLFSDPTVEVEALRLAADCEVRKADAESWKLFADEVEPGSIFESPADELPTNPDSRSSSRRHGTGQAQA